MNPGPLPPIEKKYRLTTKQMAQFVADGLLVFPELVPDEINKAAIEEMTDGSDTNFNKHGIRRGEGLYDTWPDTPGLGALVRMPEVRGIIHSLVGPNPLYDHYAFHRVAAGNTYGQHYHADAIIDTRPLHFDIQLFYYSHDTPREMGGTLFLPGSQFRLVNESTIAGHQNFAGQMPVVCKAGTLVVGHHNLWHCAQPNVTGRLRTMFKLRLNPTVRQELLWNTDDLNDPEIRSLLNKQHLWYGDEHRLEIVQRVKLWRYLTGDTNFDSGYWLTRFEYEPQEQQPVEA